MAWRERRGVCKMWYGFCIWVMHALVAPNICIKIYTNVDGALIPESSHSYKNLIFFRTMPILMAVSWKLENLSTLIFFYCSGSLPRHNHSFWPNYVCVKSHAIQLYQTNLYMLVSLPKNIDNLQPNICHIYLLILVFGTYNDDVDAKESKKEMELVIRIKKGSSRMLRKRSVLTKRSQSGYIGWLNESVVGELTGKAGGTV